MGGPGVDVQNSEFTWSCGEAEEDGEACGEGEKKAVVGIISLVVNLFKLCEVMISALFSFLFLFNC